MMGMATGKFSVVRGETTLNDYGDEVEGTTVVQSNVSGSVIEQSRSVYDPQSGRVATLRKLTGRFSNGTDIRDGDRIKDEKSDKTYLVSAIFEGTSLVGKADLVLDLTLA